MQGNDDTPELQEDLVPQLSPEILEVSSKIKQYDASHFRTSYDKSEYIGCGAFGAVRRSSHKELGLVVVKCTSLKGTKQIIERRINSFKRETEVLVRLQHTNIVRIFGVTIWRNNVGIVLEYLPCGNLSNFLKCERIPSISWWLRTMFAHQLAAALAFLHHHESHVPFSHGDIKPENILLTRDLVVKLGDFGAVNIIRATSMESTTLDIEQTKQRTVLYAAPEWLKVEETEDAPKPASALDMYSYAMVLYEIITRVTIYSGYNCTMMILTINIVRGTRPRKKELDETFQSIGSDEDRQMFKRLKEIMKKCWNGLPSERPSSATVRDQFGKDLVHMNADNVREEISRLRSTLLGDNHESNDKRVLLSAFQSPFMEATPELVQYAEFADPEDDLLSRVCAKTLESCSRKQALKRRHRFWHCFQALSRRSFKKNATGNVLLMSHKGSFKAGIMWKIDFETQAQQGRHRPDRVLGTVCRVNVIKRYTELVLPSWRESLSVLRNIFESVESIEQGSEGFQNDPTNDVTPEDLEVQSIIDSLETPEQAWLNDSPNSKSFAFSLCSMVRPDDKQLTEGFEKYGLRLTTWKRPSCYAINGVVTCQAKVKIEIVAKQLGKVFGRENLDFVLDGFAEAKWLGEDRE